MDKRILGKIKEIDKTWLSKEEAKLYLGCSDDFLKTLRDNSKISFSKFGKMIWYNLKSIDRFLTENKVV